MTAATATPAVTWIGAAGEVLERIASTQAAALEEASRWCADAIRGGGLVHLFGTGHSRIPVYADNIDNITGFVHVKDALRRITEVVTDAEKATPIKLVSTPLKQKLGKLDIVRAMLTAWPGLLNSKGTHGIPLMRHARAGGEPAKAVVDYLQSLGAA